MIELPEASVIARQMTKKLKGKQVEAGTRGNSPHKFAFYSCSAEEYAEILTGRTVGESIANGGLIFTTLDPDYVLILGGGGERILFHQDESTLPKKHHLSLAFTDGTHLTVSIQGWGSASLIHQSQAGSHPMCGGTGPSPLSEAFTYEYFRGLFDELKEDDPASVKYFVISRPGVRGFGNGCLQDVLFNARIHPRRRAIDISEEEKRRLYDAIRTTIGEMVDRGGRDSERDLYNQPGRYMRILHSKVVGQPCPECGTPIDKIQYLGGASYFCPTCQIQG